MAFNLGNFLKGVVDDVNIFDGGKSHGNPQGKPVARTQPSTANRVVAQLNPFDNGRTYNSPTAKNTKSLWQQSLDLNPIVRGFNETKNFVPMPVRDIFDANTASDQAKRIKAGDPRLYADQQKALGIKNPNQNIATSLLNNTIKLANTGKATAGGVYGLGKLGATSLFGSDQDYLNTKQGLENTFDQDLRGGLYNQGTFFDGRNDAALNGDAGALANKVVGAGVGTATEVLPWTRGGQAVSAVTNGGKVLNVAGKNALENAAYGYFGSAANQELNNGKVDPGQLLQDTLAGGALGAAIPVVGKLGSVVAKNAGKVTTALIKPTLNAADNVVQGTKKITTNLVSPEAKLARQATAEAGSIGLPKTGGDVPETTRVFIKSKFRDGGGYADIPVIRKVENKTLYQGGSADGRQFWTENKDYAAQFGKVTKKTGNFYEVDNGNRMTSVYVDAADQAKIKDPLEALKAETTLGNKKYVKDPTASTDDVLVTVDAKKFRAKADESRMNFGAKDSVTKLSGEQYGNKLERFNDFYKNNDTIQAPSAALNKDGSIVSFEGNHRFNVLSKKNNGQVVISLPKDQVELARQSGLLSKPKRSWIPDEGGFVRIPKRKGASEGEQVLDEIINDHAEFLESVQKQTGGVSTIKDADGYVTGRVSSNDAFYRKTFADKGRAPNKAEYFAEAKRQLESGQAPADVADLYNATKQMIAETPKPKPTTKLVPERVDTPELKPFTNDTDNANILNMKNKKAEVVMMSPDDYVKAITDNNSNYYNQGKRVTVDFLGGADQATITKYADEMASGKKFNMPNVDYTNGGQEGLHRALAAKQLGIKEIPVTVATKSKSTFGDVVNPTKPLPIVGEPQVRQSGFGKSAMKSAEVSEPLQQAVKQADPTYTPVTNKDQLAASEALVKKGYKKAATDVTERLNKKVLNDQDVSDSIAVIKALDAKGGTANLAQATDIIENLADHLTKAGQTVQAASLLSNRTPQGLLYGAVKALKKNGVEVTPAIQKELNAALEAVKKAKAGSYEDGLARYNLAELVSKKVPSGKMDKTVQLWKAGLLTAPTTTAGNLTANTLEQVYKRGFVDPLQTGVDALFSVFTGKRSKSLTGRGVLGGATEGLGKGVRYFKTGYDPRNPASKFDVRNIHYSDKPLGKAAEKYTQGVFKLMGAQDQPFFYASMRNSLYDQAITAAKNSGVKGDARKTFISKFITEPTKDALELANKEAKYDVFQNETALGRAASKIKKDSALGDFVIPFSGVPSSIATRIIERTPIGTAKEIASQLASGKFDQRKMTQAIANGTSGLALIGAGKTLAENSAITLGYPQDAKERRLWELEGKQPYSVKVGDKWVSMNYFQPAGTLLAAGGEYQVAKDDGATEAEAWTRAAAAAGKALTEQTFLKGVSGALGAVTDPARGASRFIENTAGSIVPNLVGSFSRSIDPLQRQVNGVGDAIQNDIPFLRQGLQAKQDAFGQDLSRPSSGINSFVNPLRPSDIKEGDDTSRELRRLQEADYGIMTPEITKVALGSDTKLTDKQITELNTKIKPEIKQAWDSIIADPRYASLDDEDKMRVLRKAKEDIYGARKKEYAAAGSIGAYDPNYTGKPSKLTKAEQALLNEKSLLDPFSVLGKEKSGEKKYNTKKKTTKKVARKSGGRKKGARKGKYNYSNRLISGTASVNAVRNLVKKGSIKAKKVSAA